MHLQLHFGIACFVRATHIQSSPFWFRTTIILGAVLTISGLVEKHLAVSASDDHFPVDIFHAVVGPCFVSKAQERRPTIIFLDEVDALCSSRALEGQVTRAYCLAIAEVFSPLLKLHIIVFTTFSFGRNAIISPLMSRGSTHLFRPLSPHAMTPLCEFQFLTSGEFKLVIFIAITHDRVPKGWNHYILPLCLCNCVGSTSKWRPCAGTA